MNLMFDIDSQIECQAEESVNEATGSPEKKYKIRGIFSTIGQKNRNGRIYPMAEWQRAVDKYQANFTNGSFNTLMEWEHPARNTVDPMQAVAKINKLYIKGDYVYGEAVLLNNEKANQLKSLIDNGIRISVSSRGTGNIQGGIVSDYDLITYDLVSEPSDYNATMNGICESYAMKDGVVLLDANGQPDDSDYKSALVDRFKNFINDINLSS